MMQKRVVVANKKQQQLFNTSIENSEEKEGDELVNLHVRTRLMPASIDHFRPGEASKDFGRELFYLSSIQVTGLDVN